MMSFPLLFSSIHLPPLFSSDPFLPPPQKGASCYSYRATLSSCFCQIFDVLLLVINTTNFPYKNASLYHSPI